MASCRSRAAAEQGPGVAAADIGDEAVEPVAAVGQPAALHVGAEEVTEDAAEVLVPRLGEERPRVGHHAHEPGEQAEIGEHVHKKESPVKGTSATVSRLTSAS